MKIQWSEVTPGLYARIRPVGGKLGHSISPNYLYDGTITSLWLEVELEPFEYTDPFYGEGTRARDMELEFAGDLSGLKLRSIGDLANLDLKTDGDEIRGAFSNSLSLVVTRLRTGELEHKRLDVELDYVLTNSDSYSMMTDDLEQHRTAQGHLKTTVDLEDLSIILPKEKSSVRRYRKALDPTVYDLRRIQQVERPNSSPSYVYYSVPLRSSSGSPSWSERIRGWWAGRAD